MRITLESLAVRIIEVRIREYSSLIMDDDGGVVDRVVLLVKGPISQVFDPGCLKDTIF